MYGKENLTQQLRLVENILVRLVAPLNTVYNQCIVEMH